jgi:hypothetical protein
MTLRVVAYVMLAVFLLLYGLAAVTNFQVAFMGVLTGLAALAAGILFVVLAVRGGP